MNFLKVPSNRLGQGAIFVSKTPKMGLIFDKKNPAHLKRLNTPLAKT